MKTINPAQLIAGLIAVALVGIALGVSSAVEADPGVALIALIVACVAGGLLVVRTLETH